jgi:Hemolysins and related proteins containing CBS domains
VNGFFAGAEVALISARKSKLRQLAEAGNVGAQAALSLLQNPERLLSVTHWASRSPASASAGPARTRCFK